VRRRRRTGVRLTALGRHGLSREAAAAALGVREEEEESVKEQVVTMMALEARAPGKNICLA
jgi:hypothetical protein